MVLLNLRPFLIIIYNADCELRANVLDLFRETNPIRRPVKCEQPRRQLNPGQNVYIDIKVKEWYNDFMDEDKRKLTVIERTEDVTEETKTEVATPKFAHPNQTNPIYKNLAKFNNAKVGDKWSIKDLLR